MSTEIARPFRAIPRGEFHAFSSYIRANVDPAQAVEFAVELYTGKLTPESVVGLRGAKQRWDPVKWLDLRLKALMWLVERGWGKAPQLLDVETHSTSTVVNVNLSGLSAEELHQLRALTAKVQGPSVTAQALSALALKEEARVERTTDQGTDVTP